MVDQEWTQRLRQQMPFAQVLGFEVVRADAAGVTLAAEWSSELCTADGVLHGGVVMAVADFGRRSVRPAQHAGRRHRHDDRRGGHPFPRCVRGGRFTAEATPIHVGRATIVLQADVIRSDGRRVSRTVQTQAVLR